VWLLPIQSAFAKLALRLFYRFEAAGARVPESGPALIVANHPNSLLDPGMVVAAAGRPVRFLAKAPLFTDPGVGWMVRGAGSIPVYRKSDDPAAMGQNEDTFRAVHRALADGAAVGIFPEGMSHNEPALAPLKTGAARMALGAAKLTGRDFPIVPVGLSFREKQTFRSGALALVGEPVAWAELAGREVEDVEAVRELTRRIEEALEEVTVNLEKWEDAPLVQAAEEIYAAELPTDPDPASRVARLRETTEALARLRAENRGEWRDLAREVAGHERVLRLLGMRPRELHGAARLPGALGWTARQLAFFALGAPVAALGILVYWLPYRLTGFLESRSGRPHDVRATFKLLVGAGLHLAWTLLIAGLIWWRFGWLAGVGALVALPLAGMVALRVVERWTQAVADARRFFMRTRRPELLGELRERQRGIARRLHALWEEVRA
jgi:1-acyl-sn-glycerol-3-phosphate acyltransferase